MSADDDHDFFASFFGSSSGGGGGGSSGGGSSGPQSVTLDAPSGEASEGIPFQLTGTILPAGYYSFEYTIEHNYGAFNYDPQTGAFSVYVLIPDDGPSPGNGTPWDIETITMNVYAVGQQSPAASDDVDVTVNNMAPTFIHPEYGGQLLIDIYDYPLGGPYAVVNGNIHDYGSQDQHIVTIDWGDGSPLEIFPLQGSIAGTHRYAPDGGDYTITVTVEDDDTGIAVYSELFDMYLLDLDVDSNNDGVINEYDDLIEEFEPGNVLIINNDDDNDNQISDMDEAGPVENENDLVPMVIQWSPAYRPYDPVFNYVGWYVTLTLDPEPSWDPYNEEYISVARLYTSLDKSGYISFEPMSDPFSIPALTWSADQAFSTTLYVEARSLGVFRFKLELREPGWGALDQDLVVFTAVEPGIDVYKMMLNVPNGILNEEIEETVGAYLPVNNDYDKYLSKNYVGATPDKDRPGPVGEDDHPEDDLLPIVANHIAAGGHYTLTIPAHVKVWQDFERTQPVDGATQIPANGNAGVRTLFVEGLSKSTGLIRADYAIGARTIVDADRIRVTTFEWAGPLNVPDYSIYTYEAVGGAAGPGESKWLTAYGGSLVGSFDHQGSGLDEGDVFWGEGATIGYAVYQAQSNYIWQLNVNLVKVVIETPTNAFTTGTIVDGGTGVKDGTMLKIVKNPDGTFAFAWAATVTLIGPSATNERKGVEWIEVGFVQNVVGLNLAGFYAGDAGAGIPDRHRHSSLNDDTPILDVTPGSYPYYSRLDEAFFRGEIIIPPPFGEPDPPGNTKTIVSRDAPQQAVPLTWDLGASVEADDQVLDHMWVEIDFLLDVAAATVDEQMPTSYDVKKIITRRATTSWTYNGNGDVGQTAPYTWNPDETSGVWFAGGWTLVSDGSRPNTTGSTANWLGRQQEWLE